VKFKAPMHIVYFVVIMVETIKGVLMLLLWFVIIIHWHRNSMTRVF